MNAFRIWRRSFPLRLGFTTAALFGALVVGVGVTAFLTASAGLYRTLDEGLLRAVRDTTPRLSRSAWRSGLAGPAALHELEERGKEAAEREEGLVLSLLRTGVHLQLVSPGGVLLERSPSLGTLAIPLPEAPDLLSSNTPRFATLRLVPAQEGGLVPRAKAVRGGTAWFLHPPASVRAVFYPLNPEEGRGPLLVGAVSTAGVRGVLLALGNRLLLMGAVALIAVGIGSALLAEGAFRPVRRIIETAEAIDEASLDTRIRAEVGDVTLDRLVDVLNRMLARLETAFRAQRRFVDDASHELRTPLASLRAELELALRRPRRPQAYREALAQALEEVDHLIDLAESLLLLARQGEPLRTRKAVDLNRLVTAALRRCEANARAGRVALLSDVPGGLAVPGDPLALERVVVNLVNNAIQASPPGGRVEVRAARGERKGVSGVALVVEDHGGGIPPEEQERIFDRFYRSRRGRRGGGAGLGLAIVKEVVSAHRGKIDIESAIGEGTRVTVFLPADPGRRDGDGQN